MDRDDQDQGEFAPRAATERPAEVLDYARPGGSRWPRPPVWQVAFSGLLLLPLILLLAYPVALTVPFGWDALAIVSVDALRLHQYGGGNSSFEISAVGSGRGANARVYNAVVVYTGSEPVDDMWVDLRTMQYHHAFAQQPRPLTSHRVLVLLLNAGFNATEAEIIADSLTDELKKLAAGEMPPEASWDSYPPPTPSSQYVMSGTYLPFWWPWYTIYCLPLWIVGWVLLGRWFMRRYWSQLYQDAPGERSPREDHLRVEW